MATNSTINLASATRDIIIEQGGSYEVSFQATRDGIPLNFTGYLLNMQVRRSFADTKVLINCTQANARLVWTDAATGRFKINIEPAATISDTVKFSSDELQSGEISAVYDIEITNPSTGVVYKPVKGSFTILREITRV